MWCVLRSRSYLRTLEITQLLATVQSAGRSGTLFAGLGDDLALILCIKDAVLGKAISVILIRDKPFYTKKADMNLNNRSMKRSIAYHKV